MYTPCVRLYAISCTMQPTTRISMSSRVEANPSYLPACSLYPFLSCLPLRLVLATRLANPSSRPAKVEGRTSRPAA